MVPHIIVVDVSQCLHHKWLLLTRFKLPITSKFYLVAYADIYKSSKQCTALTMRLIHVHEVYYIVMHKIIIM